MMPNGWLVIIGGKPLPDPPTFPRPNLYVIDQYNPSHRLTLAGIQLRISGSCLPIVPCAQCAMLRIEASGEDT